MMKVLRWLVSAAVTVAFVIGLPAIYLAGPSPFDTERGVVSIVEAVLNDTQVFEQAVLSAFILLGWVLWAYLVLSGLLEAISMASGRVRAIQGFTIGRSLVSPVVAALMWSSTATTLLASMAGAGTLALVTSEVAAAQTIDTGTPDSDNTSSASTVMRVDATSVLVDGVVAKPHVIVEHADTMWGLAERHLGDPFRWREVAELNLGLDQPNTPTVTDADLIWPGTVLLMPADATDVVTPAEEAIEALCAPQAAAASDSSSQREVIVVEPGDTMWDLAAEHTGDPFDWTALAAESLGVDQPNTPTVTDPDLIWPDTALTVPESWTLETTSPTASALEDCEPETDPSTSNDAEEPRDLDTMIVDNGTARVAPAGRGEEPTPASIVPAATTAPTPAAANGAVDDCGWWLAALISGVAASVFTAALMQILARRRSRDQALGRGVEEGPLDPITDLGDPDRDIRDHLLAAAASLANAVTTADAPLLQVDRDKTTAVFTEVVSPPTGSDWTLGKTDDQRSTWWLPHDIAERDRTDQVLFGIGDNVFLNLEVLGWLGAESSDPELALSLVRHIVHDVAANAGQDHELVIRVGRPAVGDGVEAYGVVAQTSVQDMASEMAALIADVDQAHSESVADGETCLIAELRDDMFAFPTIIYVVDLDELDAMHELVNKVAGAPGRYPIGIVSIGSSSGAPWVARVNSQAEVSLSSLYLDQNARVRPELLSRSAAAVLGAVLAGRHTTTRWTPDIPVALEPQDDHAGDEGDFILVAARAAAASARNGSVSSGVESDEPVIVDHVIDGEEDDTYADDAQRGKAVPVDEAGEPQDDRADDDAGASEGDSSGGTGGVLGAGEGAVAEDRDDDLDDLDGQGADLAATTGGFLGSARDAFTEFENPLGSGFRWDPASDDRPVVNPVFTPARLSALAEGEGFIPAANEHVELVEVRVLGGAELVDVGELSEAAQALTIMLVLHPDGLSRGAIQDRLWDGRAVTDRRVRAVIGEVQNHFGDRVRRGKMKVTLSLRSDVGMFERAIRHSESLPWRIAVDALRDAVDTCRFAEPLSGVGGRWWEWVDREGDQVRRKLIERVEDALLTAGVRALAERDWPLAQLFGSAGTAVAPASERMARLQAEAALLAGDRSGALVVVRAWEIAFEQWYEEAAPSMLRQEIAASGVDRSGTASAPIGAGSGQQ